MNDAECVSFLQWALPHLSMRWPGFRRVRRQVRRRLNARLAELGLSDAHAYRAHLAEHPAEWHRLDAMCRVTVSRFYRNRGVWAFLFDVVLPELAERSCMLGDEMLRLWSIGCASGEEPYTLAIGAEQILGSMPMEILATDADEHMLERARAGTYPSSSVRELPEAWRATSFDRGQDGTWCLRPEVRDRVRFEQQDVRHEMPHGPFDLVLCRNLAFTYFDDPLQQRVLDAIAERVVDGSALAIGHHESLPEAAPGWEPWDARRGVFRRLAVAQEPARSSE